MIPERLQVSTETHNREYRRKHKIVNPDQMVEDRVIDAFTAYDTSYWNKVKNIRRAPGRSFAGAIFQGEATGIAFVQAIRDQSMAMEYAHQVDLCEPHQKWLADIKFTDIYRYPFKNVSLADIEQMPLPLSQQDNMRILNLFHRPLIGLYHRMNRGRIDEILTYTAVEQLVHPEIPISTGLRPLGDRLSAFFGFYTPLLTTQHSDSNQNLQFAQALLWGGSAFGKALGLCVAAEMGLSPSSVIKLFKERALKTNIGWLLGPTLKPIQDELQHAYRTDGVDAIPAELRHYLQYDPYMDKKAANLLVSHYAKRDSRLNALVEPFENQTADHSIESLRKLRKIINADILSSGAQYARFTFGSDTPISEIALALRGNRGKYNKNLFFVLFFNDQQTHLTLEVNGKNNRVYGLPPELSKKYPHMDEVLVRDIIGSIIKQVELQHPEQIPIAPTRIKSASDSFIKPLLIVGSEDADLTGESIKPIKRRVLRQMLDSVITQPELPQSVQTFQRSYTVDHDEDLVRRLMGKVRNQDVQRVMETIDRLERGGIRITKLTDDTEGEDMYRAVAGKYRIQLHYENGTSFSLSKVSLRKEAYRGSRS